MRAQRDKPIRQINETRSFASERFGVEAFGLERFSRQQFRSERCDRRLRRQQGWRGSAGGEQFRAGRNSFMSPSPGGVACCGAADRQSAGLGVELEGPFVRGVLQQCGQTRGAEPLPFAIVGLWSLMSAPPWGGVLRLAKLLAAPLARGLRPANAAANRSRSLVLTKPAGAV